MKWLLLFGESEKEEGVVLTCRQTTILALAAFFLCLVMLFPAAAQEVEIAAAVAFTEGPAVDREGNVYFTEIMSQRIMKLSTDGAVRNMRVHYNFYPGRSADGMSIDTQGNLYASAGLLRTRGTSETLATKCGVYVISPEGKLIRFIPVPEDTITNNAFGGPDLKTLYITAGKTLYKVRTEIPGLPR